MAKAGLFTWGTFISTNEDWWDVGSYRGLYRGKCGDWVVGTQWVGLIEVI